MLSNFKNVPHIITHLLMGVYTTQASNGLHINYAPNARVLTHTITHLLMGVYTTQASYRLHVYQLSP